VTARPLLEELSRVTRNIRDDAITELATLRHRNESRLADLEEQGADGRARLEQAERDHPAEPPRTERAPDEQDDYYENFSVTDSWSE